VEEQSHKEEMRAALRGDFERMLERKAGESEPAEPSVPPVAVAVAEPELVADDIPSGSWLDRLLGRA